VSKGVGASKFMHEMTIDYNDVAETLGCDYGRSFGAQKHGVFVLKIEIYLL